tara:strand:+ start:323 stop:1372 length:1050 start_codon:yes stop_codon:yes gene_type:complete
VALKNKKNKLILLGLFFLTCITIIYCLFWLYFASAAKNTLTSLSITNMKLDTFKESSNISIKGFPFNIKILLDSLSLDYKFSKKLSLKSNNAKIILKPWRPRSVLVHLPQSLIFLSDSKGKKILTLTSKKIKINIKLNKHKKISSLQIFSENPKLNTHTKNTLYYAKNIQSNFSNLDANFHLIKPSMVISIEQFYSSNGLINKLNSPITLSHLEARLTQKFTNMIFHKSIELWRNQGGTIEINKLDIICDRFKINSNGTISIDDQNRPIAAFTLTTSGLIQFIDKLKKKNILTPTQAIASKVTAKVVGKKNNSNQLTFPITIQYGKVTLGSILLFDMPDIYSILKLEKS